MMSSNGSAGLNIHMDALQKNERLTLSKIVSEQLKQFIIEHKLMPGDKLPSERVMVKQLGVSRAVLREALCVLEASGIVSIRHGEGAYIQQPDMSILIDQLTFQWRHRQNLSDVDLHELRLILELNAIELIIRKGDANDLHAMEIIAERLACMHLGNEEYVQLNLTFHLNLLLASHNQYFIQLSEPIIRICAELTTDVPSGHPLPEKQPLYPLLVRSLRDRNEMEAKKTLRSLLDCKHWHL